MAQQYENTRFPGCEASCGKDAGVPDTGSAQLVNRCLELLTRRYHQLLLPIAPGISSSELYKSAVLRGDIPDSPPEFSGSALDSYQELQTAVGTVGIWQLENREDFIHAVRALAHRCEPVPIPDAVGAQYISGLINWEKINTHRARYLAQGGQNWNLEFRRFIADKSNYTDSLILLSSGFYSNVAPEEVPLSPPEWKEKSLTIRKYHELTHFIYRKVFPGDVDVIRDEALADCLGLFAAFGCCRQELAERFLGIRDGELLPDARLRHYVPEAAIPIALRQALLWIRTFSGILNLPRNEPPLSAFLK